MLRRGARCFVFGCVVSSFCWLVLIETVYKCRPKEVHSTTRSFEDNILDSGSNGEFIGLIKNEVDIEKYNDGYNRHSFNLLVSDRIGYQRDIPFTADSRCSSLNYPISQKKVSILVCFHNEAWSTLLRTVHSIIDRTPVHLLHEIIIVDDYSDDGRLIEELPNFVSKNLPVVRYHRLEKREGLIRARLQAATYATGDILVFLDSHCEVNKYWLEPLVDRIESNRKNVVCPVIDLISPDTFAYQSSPLVRGGFNWGMHFSWEALPVGTTQDSITPYRSPTMAGGLFAIERKYFFELGGYDKGMNIWGGENLEISFRIWMCGGTLEIVPCSRVGHLFRMRRPYGDVGNSHSVNIVRLVNVWLDEYKEHFYQIRPELRSIQTDVRSRIKLREDLNCKTFKWYLLEIYPELAIPNVRQGRPFIKPRAIQSEVILKGKLLNMKTRYCLDTVDNPLVKKSILILRECTDTFSSRWFLNSNEELKVNNKLCLEVFLSEAWPKKTRTMKCHGDKAGQQWIYLQKTQHLYNPSSGMCLGYWNKAVTVTICSIIDEQQWIFQ